MQQPWRQRLPSSTRVTPDAPTFFESSGYGFGLASGIDSLLGYSVSHGGGLPGYGTFYRLLPDRNLGLVVFSNLTYTSCAPVMNQAFSALFNTGGAPVRVLPVSDALANAQQTISKLYEQWDDDLITREATDSFFMYQPIFTDQPMEQRRQQFEALRKSFGKCLSTTPVEPEDALRGRWIMRCRNGRIEVFVTMASTMPPRIQMMQLTTAKSLSPALKQAAAQLIQLIRKWDDQPAKGLFARTLKRQSLQAQFEALRVHYGDLRLGDVLEGDGKSQARIRLNGKRGAVDLKIGFNPKTNKVTAVTFTRPRETVFVP